MSRFVLFLVLVFGFSTQVVALELTGELVQGGLVFGKTEPGNRVQLDGKAIPVADDGRFLLGFSRKAPANFVLTLTAPDGSKQERTLNIRQRTYKVQRINGLPSRKVTPNPEDIARIQKDNAGIGRVRGQVSRRPYFASGFIWPVMVPVSGVYGSQRILNGKPKNPHNGTDIAAPEGTPIIAPADGIVALVHDDMFYTGKTVMIDHGLGLTSVYAHMSTISVKQGDQIKKGTPIGKVGKTGRVTGAHLHWGVTLGRTHLDPALIVGKMK